MPLLTPPTFSPSTPRQPRLSNSVWSRMRAIKRYRLSGISFITMAPITNALLLLEGVSFGLPNLPSGIWVTDLRNCSTRQRIHTLALTKVRLIHMLENLRAELQVNFLCVTGRQPIKHLIYGDLYVRFCLLLLVPIKHQLLALQRFQQRTR